MIKSLRKYIILFPFIFGIWPVLTLISFNISEMQLNDGYRALLYAFIGTLLIYIFLSILIRNPIKSALLTTLIIVLFFSYGHSHDLLLDITIFGQPLGRHTILGFAYIAVFVFVSWIILRTKRELSDVPKLLGVLSVLLIIFPLYQITTYQINRSLAYKKFENDITANTDVSLQEGQPIRDVYYIITDGYPRSDFIAQYMNKDNSEFLDYLRSKGFYIAECSQSNYSTTSGSMAATLNMDYLQDNDEAGSGVLPPPSVVDEMIRFNKVQTIFSNLDYQIVSFENGYPWLNWETSHVRYDLPLDSDINFFTKAANDFEIIALHTTGVRLLIDLRILADLSREINVPITNWDVPGAPRRKTILYMLEELPKISKTIQSPKLVYFHVVFPHPPYVMDADGNFLNEEPADELPAYADQITYLNSRLKEIIDTILEESDPEPIIIIQGDHGASIDYESLDIEKANRLGILNALYLPGTEDAELYSTISPVNTFRLIFDQFFNGQFGLLPDKSILGKESPYITLDCSLDS
jgi:hypothetical protein